MTKKRKILLLHQGVWRAHQPGRLPPLPLACGYLKAAIESDSRLRAEVDVEIVSFAGGESLMQILQRAVLQETPDFIGYSVLGWNYQLFGRVAEVFRQINPAGWNVFGGTHVANQAERVFREYPAVDVVVNGEGETTFPAMIAAWLGGATPSGLETVPGISYRDGGGAVRTTPAAPRIQDLDSIVSPFLSGALPLSNGSGDFLYESALMETNRGCPYRCSFCYWGGAVGQRVRAFALDRLREEVELLARAGASHLGLCDANFGMLRQDEEFIEICIRARERHGYPRTIMTSWAKDKRQPFYRAVARMKEAGFQSSFNLALQTLTEPALDLMQRQNMRINDWKDLADWLHAQGMGVYAELIWGCPGDSYESFLDSYDELAAHVSRIATYPLLLLPNTKYAESKTELKMVVWKTEGDDFERVLSHCTMSLAENRAMHGFLFWSRVIAEHLLVRHSWRALRELGGMTQSRVLLALDEWLARNHGGAAAELWALRQAVVEELDLGSARIEAGLQFFFAHPEADALVERWWQEAIAPRLAAGTQDFLGELFRFDWIARPLYRERLSPELPLVQREDGEYYVRRGVDFGYDVAAFVSANGAAPLPAPGRQSYDVYYRRGFCNNMGLYHNAQNEAFFGRFEPCATEL